MRRALIPRSACWIIAWSPRPKMVSSPTTQPTDKERNGRLVANWSPPFSGRCKLVLLRWTESCRPVREEYLGSDRQRCCVHKRAVLKWRVPVILQKVPVATWMARETRWMMSERSWSSMWSCWPFSSNGSRSNWTRSRCGNGACQHGRRPDSSVQRRDSPRHQLADAGQRTSEVGAARDAVQQKMMEWTQERRSVLADRQVEDSDGNTHRRERAATDRNAHSATTTWRTAESLFRVSECNRLRSQVQDTWSDEISKVPNGDACLTVNEQKCSPSRNRAFVLEKWRKQPKHINERSVQQTVVTCMPEVITENDDRIQLARVLTNIDDELEMSRRHEPTRTTEQKDPSSQEPHNESARGVPHKDVVSLVPACSGARSIMTKARTPLAPRTGPSAVRNWSRGRPLTTRRLAKRMQRPLQEAEVADVRRATAEKRLASQTKWPRRQSRAKVYERNGLEVLGNNPQTWAAPAGSRRQCLAQDSAGMNGLKRKQPGIGHQGPRMKSAQANCQADRNNISRIKIPQTQSTQTDGGEPSATERNVPTLQSSTEASTVQTSSESLEAKQSQFIDEALEIPVSRRGRLDSEDRGDSSVTVHWREDRYHCWELRRHA